MTEERLFRVDTILEAVQLEMGTIPWTADPEAKELALLLRGKLPELPLDDPRRMPAAHRQNRCWDEAAELLSGRDSLGLPDFGRRAPIDPLTALAALTLLDDRKEASAPSSVGRAIAEKKHGPRSEAKSFVLKAWADEREKFKNNKAAFARRYSVIVKQKFGIDVPPKTISDVWIGAKKPP